ncbi:capsular polysaccharide synthesis enzyme CpsD, exopolysaccharide synthesis [Vibrio orientalis CIP 102891 = ATCC 33934]|uniref:Capsular polysaccharide synthesis enzyme CpsD, exopolysaccharide synthesis n=1 Tax=Vibrio orientalis CIP 102891 = ATCC 33934 TaxID=675816 RepID=C9QHF8_VIBOR|nr:exopolysaccharide transport family protein [Vibrio orientalis]EEX93689.1 exopolysaccharide biosynthesis protein [Vibrio orientalis CIP 102891 = ATCC 33934]EGU51137.1 capsular polysaccharide synthesis enzyme CpsD, exopolysaccharide synthesis [Vibrio orientalis CIP 102891 = ATCC 33934]
MIERGKSLESHVNFDPLIKAMKKHALKLVMVTAIITGLSLPLIQMMTPKYVSTATVLIKAQSDNASPVDQVDGYDSTRAQYYETQLNLMQSRVVLQSAVLRMKLEQDESFNDAVLGNEGMWDLPEETRIANALKTLSKNLKFTAVRQTQLVYVSYESPDGRRAADIANGVAQAFIDYTVEQKVAKTLQAQEWNQQQMATLKSQVEEKKRELQRFLDKEGLIMFRGIDGIETEQLSILTNKYADAKERRIAAQATYELVAKYMQGDIEDLSAVPEVSSHPQLQDLRIALIQATRNLADLQRVYGPKHRKILEANAQLDAIHKQTRHLLEELKIGLHKKYQAQLIKENHYKKLLSQDKVNYAKLIDKRDQYDSLKTDLDKTEELYEQLYQRSAEHAVNTQYREPNALIYDPATVSDRPAKPNKRLMIVMIAMMTFIIGVLFIIVHAALKRTITNLEQLQTRLGLTPLIDLPSFSDKKEQITTLELCRRITQNPYSNEIAHGLCTALSLKAPESKSVGVVAAFPHEGASAISYILASALNSNHRTLLLDLDYRSKNSMTRNVLNAFPDEGQQSGEIAGFSEYVSQKRALSEVTINIANNLTFMPLGELTESPLSFFANSDCLEAYQHLCSEFDKVIVNLPELSENKDAQMLVAALDAIIVTVKADNYTSHEIVPQLNKITALVDGDIYGVLNMTKEDMLTSEEAKRFAAHNSTELFESEELL